MLDINVAAASKDAKCHRHKRREKDVLREDLWVNDPDNNGTVWKESG
jgi:hypothetical protein